MRRDGLACCDGASCNPTPLRPSPYSAYSSSRVSQPVQMSVSPLASSARWKRCRPLVLEHGRNGNLGCWPCRGAAGGAGEMEPVQNEWVLTLEAEIFDFMEKSTKPDSFPTKEELIAAQRMDLVEAIVKHGGWLVYGWDMDGGVEVEDSNEERLGESLQGETLIEIIDSSQQEREKDVRKDGGIEGILNRLEKGRSPFNQETGGRLSSGNKHFETRDADRQAGSNLEGQGGNAFSSNLHANEPRNGSGEPRLPNADDRKGVLSDLQQLESELASVLGSLGSRANRIISPEVRRSSLNELDNLSDELEFKETEMANVRDKVRSIRAKLSALEGTMMLRSVEAAKILGEKRRRIEEANRALSVLSVAFVVWPGAASEVFLAGSFDGWTSQMRMEKSSTGVFSLCLKLYPGQYEIKFIVDGVWRVDPLRPIVYHSGFENNLLTVR